MVKRITEKRLYNITLFYLSKYEASTLKIRQMLRRRLEKAKQREEEVPPEATEWIENVIQKMKELGYVNDTRFAENQTRILARQGKSAAFIIQKLQQAGIEATVTRSLLTDREETDSERALQWLKRHRKGGFRLRRPIDETEQKSFYQKDLAALGRAGFDYQTARTALEQSGVNNQTEAPDEATFF